MENFIEKLEKIMKNTEKECEHEDAWGRVGAYSRMMGRIQTLIEEEKSQIGQEDIMGELFPW